MGTVSEGDLLWQIVKNERISIEDLEDIMLSDLPRKNDTPAVKVDASTEELVAQITNHNFVPVVDDRNVLMGIVTRKKVMQQLIEK